FGALQDLAIRDARPVVGKEWFAVLLIVRQLTRRLAGAAVENAVKRRHLQGERRESEALEKPAAQGVFQQALDVACRRRLARDRSEEHTSELQSRENLVCRLLLEKKKKAITITTLPNKQTKANTADDQAPCRQRS